MLADHLKGGWIQYEYLGPGISSNTSRYQVTVNQYLSCASQQRQIDQVVYLGVFDAVTDAYQYTLNIRHTDSIIAQKVWFSPCISPVPDICYRIDKYTTTIELANNDNGYTLAVQRCCRIQGIVNVFNSSNVGVTYTNTIPGKVNSLPFYDNNSPVFAQKDTAVVCYNSPFTFDFSATDKDGDSLVYSFTDGIIGGSAGNNGGAQPNPPSNPPYASVPYNGSYSGTTPLGNDVTIDKFSGIISGRAPSQTGDYAVAVVVMEYRKGVLIGQTRKEIHITVANCSLSAALLDPEYISCNSFTNSFFNESTNSNITSYLWDFGVPNITTDTSHQANPTYTYADTGVYTIKLTVVAGAGCTDSASAKVRVFPGFVPDFNVNGSCYLNSFLFTDATQTTYGVVDSWSWNFGDNTTQADTSHIRNPSYLYPAPANVNVQLIVTNSKGCKDTTTKAVVISARPPITLPFKDTLICSVDTLPLIAYGTGTFQWTPNYNIINANTNNPLVYPKDTTTYIVTLTDRGCTNTDSIKVNVLDFITVQLPVDTTICQTDSITLRPVSHGLQYTWTPATGLSSTTIKYPKAAPLNNITYFVEARLGKCTANTSTNIIVVPYPTVVATGDTTLCFADLATIHATTTAAHFQWSPTKSMLNTNTLNPIVGPQATTTYYISVTDTLGCPKPVKDSVLITVLPPVKAFAGNDTNVVVGQPVQLHATGGVNYVWSPSTALNSTNSADPVFIYYTGGDTITYTVRVYTAEGCYADDQVTVRVFTTQPEIFVPSGFTPNADGLNDIIKPILAGMKQLKFFRIYNRWGRQMFYTTEEGKGWDGRYDGEPQASGTYVYTAQAVDYTGRTVERKGTIVLIR
ncbi:cell surface protein [Filimonas lacunae]|nr:cell surface protein [Filimonas lacunae]